MYQYASYEEFRDNGMFSTDANCMQFFYRYEDPSVPSEVSLTQQTHDPYRVLNNKILRRLLLEVLVQKNYCPRVGSVLQQSRITYGEFGKILA